MQARTILAGCALASFLACVLNYMSPVVAVLVPLSVSHAEDQQDALSCPWD